MEFFGVFTINMQTFKEEFLTAIILFFNNSVDTYLCKMSFKLKKILESA